MRCLGCGNEHAAGTLCPRLDDRDEGGDGLFWPKRYATVEDFEDLADDAHREKTRARQDWKAIP